MQFKSIIALLLLGAVSAQGQSGSFGLKAGPVIADQHWVYAPQVGITADGISPIWGIDAGLFCEILRTDNFSLQGEIHYVGKGRTIRVIATAPANNPQGYIELGPQDIRQRFNYLSFPVLATFHFDMQPFKPFIALGPTVEYLISHPPSNVYEQFTKAEFAIQLSAGAELNLGFLPILAEVRYVDSLTNSYQNEKLTVTTRSLGFLLGVSF